MNNQSNRIRMYNAVNKSCQKYYAAFKSNSAFNECFCIYAARLTELNNRIQNGKDKAAEHTASTQTLRNELHQMATRIVNRMLEYAKDSDNKQLHSAFLDVKSELSKASSSNFVSLCKMIGSKANANYMRLLSYGVSATDIADFFLKTNEFSLKESKYGISAISGEHGSRSIIILQAEVEKTLLALDKAVEVYQIIMPEFYNDYHFSRNTFHQKEEVLSV
jgi:hypothetical protein